MPSGGTIPQKRTSVRVSDMPNTCGHSPALSLCRHLWQLLGRVRPLYDLILGQPHLWRRGWSCGAPAGVLWPGWSCGGRWEAAPPRDCCGRSSATRADCAPGYLVTSAVTPAGCPQARRARCAGSGACRPSLAQRPTQAAASRETLD